MQVRIILPGLQIPLIRNSAANVNRFTVPSVRIPVLKHDFVVVLLIELVAGYTLRFQLLTHARHGRHYKTSSLTTIETNLFNATVTKYA